MKSFVMPLALLTLVAAVVTGPAAEAPPDLSVGVTLVDILLPHELFVELGLASRRASPFKHTFVITLSNDQDFYVPTRKAFGEGSYEVTHSPLKPGGGELLADGAVRLLRQVYDAGRLANP
jgi:hypothetical protein